MPTPISIIILVISAPLSTLRHPTISVLSTITRDAFAMLSATVKLIALRMMILLKQRQKLRLRLKLRLRQIPKVKTQLVLLILKRSSRTFGRSHIMTKVSHLGPCTRLTVLWITSRRS